MALGIAFEVKCGSVTMPGEGITVAFGQVTKIPFAKMKIIIDTSLVVMAIISSFVFSSHAVRCKLMSISHPKRKPTIN